MSGIGKWAALAIGVSLSGMAVAAPAGAELADTLVIHAGAVVAILGEKPLGPSTIVVRDGRIAEIQPGYLERADVRVIDLKDRTLLPGLIDTHVHFSFSPETKLWAAAVDRKSVV